MQLVSRNLPRFCDGVVPIHLSDEIESYALRACRLTLSVVRAVAKTELVHFLNHCYGAAILFRSTLRQIVEL